MCGHSRWVQPPWGLHERRSVRTANVEGCRQDVNRMATANPLEPVWEDLRALNLSLQRTLDEFKSSFHRANTAGKEMPDARVRLDHVLELTEEAAHRTLDLVERSGPLASRTASEAAALIEPIRTAKAAYSNSG